MEYLEVIPAYGRDYTSQKAVLADWEASRDFKIVSVGPDYGRYISKGDAEGTSLLVRYSKLQKVMSIITP